MPTFSYVVIESNGRRRAGTTDSPTESALNVRFEESGEFVVRVEQVDRSSGRVTGRVVSPKRLLDITRSLAALIPAGLPLSEAIQTAAQMADLQTRAVLDDVRERLEHGETLAAAMAESSSFFPAYYVSLVAAGEQSGSLAASVTKLAAQLEHEDRLRSQLIAAAIYPILLSVASTVSALLLVGFVLPRFAVLLGTTGARLPALAALSLRFAFLMRSALPPMAVGTVLVASALAIYARTEAGVQRRSSLLHRLPFVGSVRREQMSSRFARLAGLLLGGGVPLSQTMDAAVDAIDDPVGQNAIRDVRADVLTGATLSSALAARHFFPSVMTRLVVLGEKSGRLPEFLLQAADYYDERLQGQARKLIAIAEPTVILLFGGVVGVIALALLQTVYGVNPSTLR